MGLSEKILELRTTAGYSQDELARLLHVSNEGVSRWETGSARPTPDNLAALSRLFQVPLNALMGMAEESKAAEVERKLNRELLRITRSCHLAFVLAGVLFVGLAIGIWISAARITELNDQVTVLFSQISVLKNEALLSRRDAAPSTGWRAENSLVTHYAYQLERYDPKTGIMTLYISATPKVYEQGTTAVFAAAADGIQTVEVPGIIDSGNAFTCTLEVPAVDDLRLSIAFVQNGEAHTQFLETIVGLKENLQLRVWSVYDGEVNRQGNTLTLPGEISVHTIPVNNAPGSNAVEHSLWSWPISGKVELLADGVVVKTVQIPIDDVFIESGLIGEYSEFTEVTFSARFSSEISVPKSSKLDLAVTVIDNFDIAHTQTIPLSE